MIKQINRLVKTFIKSEQDLVLDNLISDLQKQIFLMFYMQKMKRKDIEKQLKISRYKLETNLEIIRQKILKIPEFDCKFKVEEASEKQIRNRCQRLGKSKEYEDFCVLAFYKKLKKKDIADIMCIDIETVRKYKSIRRKELEN